MRHADTAPPRARAREYLRGWNPDPAIKTKSAKRGFQLVSSRVPERDMEEALLVVESRGPVRVVTLNRPRQLNTLTRSMVGGLHELWSEWEANPSVKCVVLRGAGNGRALCAGGDVRSVHDMRPPPGDPRRARAPIDALDFFETEYKMNLFLNTMQTPHVALIDGITLGGGCGVSINGRFRVATERTAMGMPECGIGLVPDVGGTHFLSALPGEFGTCMALTGRRVGGADAKAMGLATHLVRSGDLDRVVDALAEALGDAAGAGDEARGGDRGTGLVDAVDACLRGLEREAVTAAGGAARAAGTGASGTGAGLARVGDGDLTSHRALVHRWFAADTVEDIVAALSSSASSASASSSSEQKLASELLCAMRTSSPTSLKVTLAALRRASPKSAAGPDAQTVTPPRSLSLAECLRAELCMVAACLARDDFYEGVRAKLVDKGKGPPPAWRPGELAAVSAEDVGAFFQPETEEVAAVVRRFEEAVGLEPNKELVRMGKRPRL